MKKGIPHLKIGFKMPVDTIMNILHSGHPVCCFDVDF